MTKVSYRQPNGIETVIDATVGDSVMQTAVRHGISGIVGQCGGVLSCATCHVFVDPAELPLFPAMDDVEDEMLDCAATDREDNSRLSCQLPVLEGQDLHMTIPRGQL